MSTIPAREIDRRSPLLHQVVHGRCGQMPPTFPAPEQVILIRKIPGGQIPDQGFVDRLVEHHYVHFPGLALPVPDLRPRFHMAHLADFQPDQDTGPDPVVDSRTDLKTYIRWSED